jgi:toxin ParE1/3/4
MKIVFSDEADADLLHILTYLAERNRLAALALAKVFNARIENLVRFPFIGRDRSAFSQDLRSIVVENYVVFYRIQKERVLIVRVLDGRRDIEAEFTN